MRMFDTGLGRRTRVAVTAWWAVVGALLLANSAHIVLGLGPDGSEWLSGVPYCVVLAGASLGILWRALALGTERIAWALVGVAALSWTIGEIYWKAVIVGMDEAPFPSVADAFYLGLYPPLYIALVLMLRGRVGHFHASQWLDGIAASAALAAIGAALILPPVLDSSTGSPAAVATNLAYPLGDFLVLVLAAGVVALTGWRPGRALALLGLGCVVFSLADVTFLYRAATGADVIDLGLSDLLWPAGLVIMGLAAWQPTRATRAARIEGWGLMAVPATVSVIALVLIVRNQYVDQDALVVWLSVGALVVCMARATLTFRENIALADSHRQAVTDALTGLPNRRLFNDRVERALALARREGNRVAVMIIDLDRFKEVNDTLGHASGDVLLQEIARRLVRSVRESDTIARLGGDEFAVLLPEVSDATGAALVAASLNASIAEPILLEGLSLDTEASIGIAMYPGDGDDVAQLLQRADVAMYTAKGDHLGHAFYGSEHDNYSPERLALVGELRTAIENEELVLHYQPKVDLTSGQLAGVEVLLRWQHPVRGLLPPGDFVPLAEHTTLIKPLTLHVLTRALAQVREWDGQGRHLSVAVNVSARNLLDPDFAEAVAACLDLAGVEASRLELEITETVLMANPARALEVLKRLSDMGVSLSIDDFGTGYSSLDYLKRLPVNVLKIDKSFVMNMADDPADAMIVRSTIDLARNLGLRVVAEGIEDQSAYDMLQSLGCHVGQGFLMSRPVLPADLELLLDGRDAGRTVPAGVSASAPSP